MESKIILTEISRENLEELYIKALATCFNEWGISEQEAHTYILNSIGRIKIG